MIEHEIKERIGWLAAECGTEDSKIESLEKELARRKARRAIMWNECSKLTEKLLEKGADNRA